jgi:dolichol-phosphate mannosyltransferase
VFRVLESADESLRLSVVLPTFNESRNIAEVIASLSARLSPVLGDSYELIVVDDNSPDRTWETALALCKDYNHVRVMNRTSERGLASAVIRGWQVARGEVLAVIDADLQHPPDAMAQLWNEMELGADLAVASRHVSGGGVSDWSFIRRLVSRGAQAIGLVLLPEVIGKVTDPMSGYFMVRRSAIANTTFKPVGYKILIEVLGRGRFRSIREIGYVFRERQNGDSKLGPRVYLEYLMHLASLRVERTLSTRLFTRSSK